ncbi:pentatricopeptide repeat-containing protein At3g12770-like [Zingiber officinale]|uniref:pentatricopeptide repeat-containing protein At3g12770-like n=1 Tax=Zingiber officinale TaxID=94328 RepID=UPI001C4A8777|nr:pentatricopeptide repeat-containing protein At3g12770-like [Zingiber officinale]
MAAILSAFRRPPNSYRFPCPLNSSKFTASSFPDVSMPDSGGAGGDTIDRVISLLPAAAHSSHLHQIHALIISAGLHHSPFVAAKFLLAAPAAHQLPHARRVFDEMPHRKDVLLFNAIIRLCSYHNAFRDALHLFAEMIRSGVIPDAFTMPPVLKACAALPSLAAGRAAHAQVLSLGFDSDVFVQNGLISMYAKCGDIASARATFDLLSVRNVISWTSILSGCTQNGFPLEALKVFDRMRRESNAPPDFIVIVSVLKAYMDVGDLELGRSVHGLVIKSGFEDEHDLIISLAAMYAKCGEVLVARLLFDSVRSTDIIMWNVMISGYAKNGHAAEAFQLFREMVSREIKPDSISLGSAILACAQVGSLELAKWMEDYTNSTEFKDDIFVNTAMIDMYAKCGSIAHALRMFEHVVDKDVVVWSTIIKGYGLHGCGHVAIRFFNEMKHSGVKPNDVTFIGLLSACNHAGLVEEGWGYFHSMRSHGIEPRHQHYACVVDLISRAGKLEQAFEFIKGMPMEPELTVWGALLNACKIHGNVRLGEYAAKHVFALEPLNAGHYVKLSNIYASAGMWSDVAKVRVLMKQRGVVKAIGCSTIDLKGELHSFRAGDRSHPRMNDILAMLGEMERKLKESGFVPHLTSDLHDLNMEEKEVSLYHHSEMIAIAFGLITTDPGSTIMIMKNLRSCMNCHSATKLISKLTAREIVVRDINRFHHFKNGLCSCRDYW